MGEHMISKIEYIGISVAWQMVGETTMSCVTGYKGNKQWYSLINRIGSGSHPRIYENRTKKRKKINKGGKYVV
jgi:hypothetical protein